ncbi:uncharacterized protein LOC130805706 [Amaranthus tricolor]|uniref:uncharacterized protein LOC130805706 n=1 Tax=Amaranthus tricolor TaxID=29722 RepID=UPI002586ACF2|nr:uncharacterized protein LOC130805706 [Amaranthus tricolor]
MTPIGMKNVVPPYLILIDYIFTSQQGGILEVYIDDFIVKSKTELDIVCCPIFSWGMNKYFSWGEGLTKACFVRAQAARLQPALPSPNHYRRGSQTTLTCSRLKRVLGSIISQNQGAFVTGRLISHNILLCHDLVKHYSKRNCYPSCMIKVDLRKTYDTMDWDFIHDMLITLNFPPQVIKIIMVCITSTQYSLMVDGSPSNIFKPKRGLQQGDPLSSLLYVIGMEYLSRILMEAGGNQQFRFHLRCKGLKLNHLCFADDLMLFWVQNPVQIRANMLDMPLGKLPVKYLLSVPLTSKRITGTDCHTLVDKMTAKIRSWSSKFLSYAARVQLDYVVPQSICTYWSQLFILPKLVIKKVNAICRAYMWHVDPNNTALGNINWTDICKPKKLGGLGIKIIGKWNEVAVGKLARHVAYLSESLWVR